MGAALLAAILPACSQEAPQYPDRALLLCESAADCPSDWECLPCPEERRTIDGCPADAQFCSPQFDNVCGTPKRQPPAVAMGTSKRGKPATTAIPKMVMRARRSVTKPIPAVMAWSMLSLARSVMMGRSIPMHTISMEPRLYVEKAAPDHSPLVGIQSYKRRRARRVTTAIACMRLAPILSPPVRRFVARPVSGSLGSRIIVVMAIWMRAKCVMTAIRLIQWARAIRNVPR